MNRIQQTFAHIEPNSAFIAFITAGDVNTSAPLEGTVKIMHGLVEGGANIIELGVPFSDPSADGPIIQRSNERALAKNVSIKDVLQIAQAFRETNTKTPVVLMGYLNPIENLGYQKFIELAVVSGVDGLITVDLPPEEGYDFNQNLIANNICPIYLLAPTTTEQRAKLILKNAQGFVYYVSVKGVTGQKKPDYSVVKQHINKLKNLTDLPIGVGFGIKDRQTVQKMSEFADAVVVGSAIVEHLQNATGNLKNAARDFVASLKP